MALTDAQRRPDLEAHDRALRLPIDALVAELRDQLGVRLVAVLAGVGETRAVHEWAEGGRAPREETANRLRLAYRITAMLTARDAPEVAQAWWQGLNPQLDDRSPARLLRDGDLDEVGPQLLAAARAFNAGA